jgi:hypothetical protein
MQPGIAVDQESPPSRDATSSTSSSRNAPEAAAQVLQLATGHILASALQVVVRLDIPDRLAGGPRTAADLAGDAGVQEDPLYRVLRALASVGLFSEEAPRRFALTPAGQKLRKDVPGSLRDTVLWVTSPFGFRVHAELIHSVRTGQPAAEKLSGMPLFDYLARERDLAEVFNNAMSAFSNLVIPAALEAYDFSGIDRLVDVAGGHGAVLVAILKKYPSMRGVLFDLEHVVAGARATIEASGVGDRLETQPGDFFEAVPEGGDAYVMKHIIHDWDDERALAILRNIRRAMGDRPSRVILLETVISPGDAPEYGKILDLQMLAFPGGRERTEEEFRGLFACAGFELTRVVPTRSPLSVIEARRRE